MTDTPKDPDYVAYSVKNRGADKDAAWNRVGAAWQHRDGKGYDVQLDATPVDGRVTLREQKRKDYREQRREDNQVHEPSRTR